MAKVASSGSTQVRSKRARTFFDSNILLYCDDSKDPARRNVALKLVLEHLENSSGVVSMQVLQEYYYNATNKFQIDPGLARQKVRIYTQFEVVEPTTDDVFAAIDLHRLNQISFWDAMIVHCAKKSGCRTVHTEDMQHGQIIDGVTIFNPFR